MSQQSNQPYYHPCALVESDQIGAGTRIWANAHVLKGAVIGANCNIGDGVFIEGGARVGNNVTIKNQCLIWEGVFIGDNAFVGPNVVFTNDLWPRSPRQEAARKRYATKEWLVPTRIDEGASLGASVTLVCGVTVGAYAMVGTGSVVTRDIPAHALVYGVPARVVGAVCRCGQRIEFQNLQSTCAACGHSYRKENGQIQWVGPNKS